MLNRNPPALPVHNCAETLSSKFSIYFADKITTIRRNLDSTQSENKFPDPTSVDFPPLSCFSPATTGEVLNVIKQSRNASSILDPVPTWFLKERRNIHCLLPVLTEIINSSLLSGTFPSAARKAIIRPTLKKSSLDKNSLRNYRPVSNLSFLGKILEKVACSRLIKHMNENNLTDPFQSAYKSCHSTETALVKVKNDIMAALDVNQVVLLVLLDLSAAFDTIDRQTLLSRLSRRIGVHDIALQWFESYLAEWSTRVNVKGKLSSPSPVTIGLPQGSVFGPLGYTIYTLPIGDTARHHHVSYHTYADDTQLYVTFDPKIPGNQETALETLSLCILDIQSWMTFNKLKLNQDKTEFLVIGSQHNLKRLHNPILRVGDTQVTASTSVRNLGAYLDCNMTMIPHVTISVVLHGFI